MVFSQTIFVYFFQSKKKEIYFATRLDIKTLIFFKESFKKSMWKALKRKFKL